MEKQFGKGVSYTRDIFEYSKTNATEKDKKEIADIILKIKDKF